MLGVRRVSITAAARSLQHDGPIGYVRGELTVLERPRLENMACGCYGSDRRGYMEALGSGMAAVFVTMCASAQRRERSCSNLQPCEHGP